MKNVTRIAAVSAFALAVGSLPAVAQTTLLGSSAVDDQIDDLTIKANRDMARGNDELRFGNPDARQGMSGSASLGYSGKTGNNESQDFSAGARLRYAQGPMVQTLSFLVDYSEADNVKSKEDISAVYDANYYFNDKFYGFVLGRVTTDGLASVASAENDPAKALAKDAFLGFGPGYRIVNNDNIAWRVQAGAGISYLEFGDDNSTTEAAGIVSSRFFYKISDTVFASMDTDIIKSDTALRIGNDLGVNFKVTDAFSTRVSYLTEYNDSRAIRADNKLGVSLVYGF
jgi:putative salt-induced outer membrane protein